MSEQQRMTADMAAQFIEQEAAFEAWQAEQEERLRRECGREYTTRGSDPWVFTCELAKDHTGPHAMTNPMGPGTPTFTWGLGYGGLRKASGLPLV